jgi:hypothetical protein
VEGDQQQTTSRRLVVTTRKAFWLIVVGLAVFVVGLVLFIPSFAVNGVLFFAGFCFMVASLALVAAGLVLT